MPADTPRTIGRYEVLTQLGRGAMGAVYKARDPQLDRIVAIKMVRTDLGLPPEHYDVYKRRFSQEAMAAGRLNHPNLVAIYDVMEIDATPYIVMEYVESDTLADLIRARGALPAAQAVDVTLQVCRALEYAHAHGIVHRDIKPANILVGRNGDVKVSDFGIARIEGQDFTQTGVTLGTPSYMSPEQIRGHGVDGRSDLFSLGAVFYEALTGDKPFLGTDTATLLYSILNDTPTPLRERNPSLHPALDTVIGRALAKDREQRYQNARAFADALGETAAGTQEPTVALEPPRSEPPASPPPPARRWAVLVGACCVLLSASGVLAYWYVASKPPVGRTAPVGPASSDPRPAVASRPADQTPPIATGASLPATGGDPAAPAERLGPEKRPGSDLPPKNADRLKDADKPNDGDKKVPALPPRTTGQAPPLTEEKARAVTPPVVPPPPPPPPPRGAPLAVPGGAVVPPSAPVEGRPAAPPLAVIREQPRPETDPPNASKEQRPPGPAVVRNAPSPPTAAPRTDIAGRWQGRYQCQREDIGLSLSITNGDGNRIDAVFEFFPLPGTLSFPRGSFRMTGEYDRVDGSIRLQNAGWIQRPLGFQAHDIEGQLEANGGTINGRVLTAGCAHFALARK